MKKDYWKDGKIKQERIYAPDGRLAVKIDYRRDGTVDKYEKFDGDGNRIAEAHYGADGRLDRNPVDNWAAMRWKYKDGKLIRESYYGEDGRLKERKEYNESGDLIAKEYVDDGDIDESEEFNTEFMAPEEFSEYYDPSGRFLGEMASFR